VIQITDDFSETVLIFCAWWGGVCNQPRYYGAVERLAEAGEEAGLSIEQVIQILNAGVGVETLLDLIDRSLAELSHNGFRFRRSKWLPAEMEYC
jgi:hypothetical protein